MALKILPRFCWLVGLMMLLPYLAVAQRDWVFVGPRAVGMGSAYLAVSNNAEAVYWNPAALARMEHFHFTFGYGDFYKVNFKSYYASTVFNFPLGRRVADYFTFGLDWLGLQDSSQSKTDTQNQFHAALGIKPFKSLPTLSFGVSTNLRHKDDWNVGALYSLPFIPYKSWGRLSLGMMYHHRYGTPEKRPIDHKNILKDHRVRYGVSYQFFKGWGPLWNPLFAIDYGERLHLGSETSVRLMNKLKALIRIGLQKDLKNRERITRSFGLTLNYDFSRDQMKMALTAMPRAEIVEVATETRQPEACFHFARTNSPEWNSCYQYGVAVVIPATHIPVPAPGSFGICPSSINLNWSGSSESYEDGYIILRNKVKTGAGFWFIAGLSWRERTYSDVELNPGSYVYQIVAYKDNIDKLQISTPEDCQVTAATVPVDWLCNLVILHHSKSICLTFGQAATATQNLDTFFCEQQLTSAQSNVFDARFATSQSLIDIRENTLDAVVWNITLQPDQNGEKFNLSWDQSTLPVNTSDLVQLKICSDIDHPWLNMRCQNQITIGPDEQVTGIEIRFKKAPNQSN